MIDKLRAYHDGLSTYDKKVKLPAIGVNCSFLSIHMALFIVFLIYHVTPMVYFNIGSMLFYCGTFILINKKKETLFVMLVYLEVLIHMFMAIFFTGWGSGFQVTLIGITIMLFYSEYTGRVMGYKLMRSLPMAVGTAAVYLLACVLTDLFPPLYPFPHDVELIIRFLWGVITFAIEIVFLGIFCNLASNSEIALAERVAHDELTGLFSRYFMNDYLQKLLNERDWNRYWLAIADIDDFKQVNDTYGHNCGDQVLCEIAERLRSGLPHCDVCRWGGEEFLMVGHLREELKQGDLQQVAAALDRVRIDVGGTPVKYEEEEFRVTITIGVSVFEEGDTADSWIDRADALLYHGKRTGKNQVVTHEC